MITPCVISTEDTTYPTMVMMSSCWVVAMGLALDPS